MATATGNWNIPDCGKPYNAIQSINLHASHAGLDQSDAGDQGVRRTIEDTLTVVSANVLGFGGPLTVHKWGPQGFVQYWGLGHPVELVIILRSNRIVCEPSRPIWLVWLSQT